MSTYPKWFEAPLRAAANEGNVQEVKRLLGVALGHALLEACHREDSAVAWMLARAGVGAKQIRDYLQGGEGVPNIVGID